MAKGWKMIATSDMSYGNTTTPAQKRRNEHGMRNLIRNTATMKKEEDLKKESDNAGDVKAMQEAQLKVAYTEKKLKSKRLIKQAQKLRKAKAEDVAAEQ